jgi:hypothetical protein
VRSALRAARITARVAVLLGLAVVCVLSVVSLPAAPSPPALEPAADASAFRPGNIIADAVFYDSGAMTATQVQGFLNGEGASCVAAAGGPACLKSYRLSTTSQAPDAFCTRGYAGATNETAASIITKVAVGCGINPRVLLVMLQKETGLVARNAPTQHLYDRALGFGCPDSANGTCSAYYPGLFKQLYFAAKQFKRYAANPTNYGYVPGLVNTILYNPNPACGSARVLIENQATAGLYNYTPYVPNAQALAAGYGAGTSSCSSFGNRNFWLYFTDWFGSTQTVGRDVDAPVGNLDGVSTTVSSVSVRGWNYDPNALTTSLTVHVYIDGRFAGAIPANQSRPDVAAYYRGVGAAHGFSGAVVALPGKRTVCVYSVNTGPGYTNPLEGCRTVTVPGFPPHNPIGGLDDASASVLSVTMHGWAIDPDAPTLPVRVHIYLDGHAVSATTANTARTDIGLAYPRATPAHGFTWTGNLPGGTHQVCAYAINLSAGTANPQLGCRTVTLGGPPYGAQEQTTTPGPASVRVTGWTIDPDTTSPISVQVYVDHVLKGSVLADDPRADVGTSHPGYGTAHGFDITVPAPGGTRLVCAYAQNTLSGGVNTRLGCAAPNVPAALPTGNVDAAANGTNATYGWALDKDAPTLPVTVDVKVDGVLKATVTANVARADIGAAFPGAGVYHGWRTTLTMPSGTHTVCAFGRNLAAGAGSAQLNCRSVTVP